MPGNAHCHGVEGFETFLQIVYSVSRGPVNLPRKVGKKKRSLLARIDM